MTLARCTCNYRKLTTVEYTLRRYRYWSFVSKQLRRFRTEQQTELVQGTYTDNVVLCLVIVGSLHTERYITGTIDSFDMFLCISKSIHFMQTEAINREQFQDHDEENCNALLIEISEEENTSIVLSVVPCRIFAMLWADVIGRSSQRNESIINYSEYRFPWPILGRS